MPVCKTSGKCPVNKVGDKMMADDNKMSLFKSVVAQFIGSQLSSLRGWVSQPKQSLGI
jgi:hypothetical protein